MKTLRQYCFALFAIFFSANALSQESVNYIPAISQTDINKAWFKPSLLENKNPVLCNSLFEKSDKAFFSSERDLYFSFDDLSSSLERIWDHYGAARNTTKLTINNKPVYVGANCYGAGSDNESCGIWASQLAEVNESDLSQLPETQKINTSENIKLVKSKEGRYWLITATLPAVYSIYIGDEWKKYNSDEAFIEAFEITENYTWKRICGVTLKPTQNLLLKTRGLDEAFDSLEKIKSTADKVTGGSGGVRHGFYSSMFMDKILYRPWSLSASKENPGEIHPAIIEWGYLGFSEFQKIGNYKNQLEETSKEIAKFYNFNYGWNAKEAYNMAHSAILGALNVDNKFGGYTRLFSESEKKLRKAILEKKSLDEIKAIPLELNAASIHVAVMHPAALNYLLEKGIDPNAQNDFGKTALMYAAQYNQLESVRILLAKGANPNLFTVIKGEGLKRSGMTALHYAVRYASGDVIKALLKAGAFPFARTSEAENYLPLDWLRIYISNEAKEPNLNIGKNQLIEIESLLKRLNVEEQDKKIFEYILQGEKEYQKNHNKLAAYDQFKFALALDPKNERALNDFALLSIAMEKWNEALEASQYIIDNSKNDLTKSNAYYNYGLACEKNIDQYGSTWTQYNGKTYCTQGVLDPFIKSYQLKPKPIKAEKIISIFNSKKIKTCNSPTNESIIFQLSFVCEEKSELCVLSKTGKLINIDSTFNVLNCPSCGLNAKIIERGEYYRMHPSLKNIYELGDYQLATYTGNKLRNGKFFIDDKVCDENTGIRNPEHSYLDNEILSQSKNETDALPRENIVPNSAALRTLFYLMPSYNRLQIRSVQGNIYVQFPDNTYVKVVAGDRLANGAKLYIPKGNSFTYGESDLEPDLQNDRILKVMDRDDFTKSEGKNMKASNQSLVDLDKLAQ